MLSIDTTHAQNAAAKLVHSTGLILRDALALRFERHAHWDEPEPASASSSA
jgi:hypothetical protein